VHNKRCTAAAGDALINASAAEDDRRGGGTRIAQFR
jgi:hypothetical protein